MTILNVGSINIDSVYRVKHIPKPGETLSAVGNENFLGGKGLNQTVAIAKSGGQVLHVGAIGKADPWIIDDLMEFGVDCKYITTLEAETTGQAIIYVADDGENSIVLSAGANHHLSENTVKITIEEQSDINWVLVQNETNATDIAIRVAHENRIKIAYSAAPFDIDKLMPHIAKINLLSVNEIEYAQLLAKVGSLQNLPKNLSLLITKGTNGAEYLNRGISTLIDAPIVKAIDTTGAGDTFLGYFLSALDNGQNVKTALRIAAAAAAIQVTKVGAARSIPSIEEVIATCDLAYNVDPPLTSEIDPSALENRGN